MQGLNNLLRKIESQNRINRAKNLELLKSLTTKQINQRLLGIDIELSSNDIDNFEKKIMKLDREELNQELQRRCEERKNENS